MPEFSAVELGDIQGIILSAHGHLPYASYLFFRIERREGAGSWLERLAPSVTTASRWRVSADGNKIKPPVTLNIGLTFQGLKALGLPEAALNTFEPEFAMDMAARAVILGDDGTGAPERWVVGGPSTEPVHGVLVLNALDERGIDREREEQRRILAAASGAVVEVAEEHGFRPSSSKEPLGFLDGISQPTVERTVGNPEPSATVVRAGEFVLGYLNGYDEYPLTPGVPAEADPQNILPGLPDGGVRGWKDLGGRGSFMVYRKLAQDVAGFWTYVAEQAVKGADGRPDPIDMVRLASKCIGRWPSGAPLTLAPDHDDPELGADADRNNAFTFIYLDREGYGCPIGSHIRRANPRDSRIDEPPTQSIATSNRHRILRRSVSYGKDLFPRADVETGRFPQPLADDGEERGIHFVAINASIRRQFEFLQTTWCNASSFNGLLDNKDPLIGDNDGTGTMVIQQSPLRRQLPRFPRVVTTRGGGYFFLPSLTALHYLANLHLQQSAVTT